MNSKRRLLWLCGRKLMNKTLKLSFALKNTYRVNSILYSLKQIPLIKRLLPDTLYQAKELKIFANIISVLWEIAFVFLGKLLYLFLMVYGAAIAYDSPAGGRLFLHILLFLTVIGGYANTHIFNPTKDKYYAMILMRMDAREYTVVNYAYAILKVLLGFLPFTLLFGRLLALPLWICFLLPFSVAGCKLAVAAFSLWDYERRGCGYNENKLGKFLWLGMALLLGAAYGLPALGFVLPETVSVGFLFTFILAGLIGIRKIYMFEDYKAINKELLSGITNQMDFTVKAAKTANEKRISTDHSITSNKKGFEYLNELFIKRHKKILWSSAKKIAGVCLALVCGILLFLYLQPEAKASVNKISLTCLPYFTFIMYSINRGTGFTQALFMNCDHSMLTYPFYKQPRSVLKLFQIRLREIMKINAVPALIIGVGLALILRVSGGTDQPLTYVILVVSILSMSLFFSVHYLTIYYLLQPYNAGTEIKSGMYKVIMTITYFCCFSLMYLRMSTFVFGAVMIGFCVTYSVVSCVLVYKFAPKTFKLRV